MAKNMLQEKMGGPKKVDFYQDRRNKRETELPDFSWYTIPKWGNIYRKGLKLYQSLIKYTNWP
jgi:hypothetical protein